jgi:hypothetical protein
LDESQRTLSGQVSPNRLGRKHGKTSGLVKISSKNRVIWARKNDYARWNRESYVLKKQSAFLRRKIFSVNCVMMATN